MIKYRPSSSKSSSSSLGTDRAKLCVACPLGLTLVTIGVSLLGRTDDKKNDHVTYHIMTTKTSFTQCWCISRILVSINNIPAGLAAGFAPLLLTTGADKQKT